MDVEIVGRLLSTLPEEDDHPTITAEGWLHCLTVARELQRSGGRYGIVAACIGGQGIAVLLENPAAQNGNGKGKH